jgi:hypothetical protein
VCAGQKYVCPEPEKRLADTHEHNYPRAPLTPYGSMQVPAITTSTAGTAGTSMLGSYLSTGPQFPALVPSSVFRLV